MTVEAGSDPLPVPAAEAQLKSAPLRCLVESEVFAVGKYNPESGVF